MIKSILFTGFDNMIGILKQQCPAFFAGSAAAILPASFAGMRLIK